MAFKDLKEHVEETFGVNAWDAQVVFRKVWYTDSVREYRRYYRKTSTYKAANRERMRAVNAANRVAPKHVCSVEGCGSARFGHGLCNKHYKRMRKGRL